MSNIVSTYGLEKTGKTTFGFSAIRAFSTGIMVHFDFDLGRERAIWRFTDAEKERIKSVRFPETPTWTLGSGVITKQWAEFDRIYEQALYDTQVVAIFIDTATQMHRLNSNEYLENYVKRNKPNRHQLQQIEYRVPNDRTRAKIMSARTHDKTLILSHYESDTYNEQFVTQNDGSVKKESVKTGQKIHSGFGEIPYLVDHHLHLLLRTETIDPNSPPRIWTEARIETPNPPKSYGYTLITPNYKMLVDCIEGLKQQTLLEEQQIGGSASV